jgi:hypothetical protein
MLANLLTSLKSATKFVAILSFAVLVTSDGYAADLAIPTKATPRREQHPSAKSREQLFKEFLDWKRSQQR